MRKLNYLLIILITVFFSFSFIASQDYSSTSGSTQNVVNSASAQISPPATEYIQKTSSAGFPELYDSKGNIVARGDEHFQLTSNKGQITFKDNGAGKTNEELEFGNFAKDQTFKVSQTGLFSEVSFDPKNNTLYLNDKSVADVFISGEKGTELKQITDAKITLGENGNVDYASFVSKNGGNYVFYYQGMNYNINANAGDKIIFDPKNNKLIGAGLSGKEMNFGLDEQEQADSNSLQNKGAVKARDFEVSIDSNGNINEINFIHGGTYQDSENKMHYSSGEKFSVFYDGRDIKDYAGNAVSIFNDKEGLSVKATGLVNVEDLDKKIFYTGKTAGVYTEYDYDTSFFDIQNGEASVSNGKHNIEIKNGLTMNLDNLEYSGEEASPFSVSSTQDGSNEKSLIVDYFSNDGKIQTNAVYFEDGKETLVNLGSLNDAEAKYLSRTQLTTLADVDLEMLLLDENDPQYTKKIADLYTTRGLISQNELSTYKIGQEVFDVNQYGADRIGTIESVNEDGSFVIGGKTYTSNQLDNFQVSKLSSGQLVGETNIKEINFDRISNQITYTFDDGRIGSEKETTSAYFTEDYKTAIEYYRDAKKNPSLENSASFALASVYQQMGDTSSAKDQYIGLLRDSELGSEEKSRVYNGLISTYLQEGNPTLALSASFDATQTNPNDASITQLNKYLTKSYLETIGSAINTEDASIVNAWKQKVGFDKNWYEVGLDQPIVSWFKEDINFATGFSRDQLSEQQKGILVMENLVDRGYDLNQIKTLSDTQISNIFDLSDQPTINNMRTALQSAFQNPDVQNLANGAKKSFDFETGTGYIDKSFLEKNWAEQVLSDTNVKTSAEAVAIGVVSAPLARLATNTIEMSSLGSTTFGKALTTPITINNLKQFSANLETQSMIKNLASESGATFGKTTLAEGSVMSLEFEDMASVRNFMNKEVVGSTEKGIRIITSDKYSGQYLLELNGQKFMTKLGGQEISGIMDSNLLSSYADDTLSIGAGSYEEGRYLLTAAEKPTLLLPPDATLSPNSIVMRKLNPGEKITLMSNSDISLYTTTIDSELDFQGALFDRPFSEIVADAKSFGIKYYRSTNLVSESMRSANSEGLTLSGINEGKSVGVLEQSPYREISYFVHENIHTENFIKWMDRHYPSLQLNDQNFNMYRNGYMNSLSATTTKYFNPVKLQFLDTPIETDALPFIMTEAMADELNAQIAGDVVDGLVGSELTGRPLAIYRPGMSIDEKAELLAYVKKTNSKPIILDFGEDTFMKEVAGVYNAVMDKPLYSFSKIDSIAKETPLTKLVKKCISCGSQAHVEGANFCEYCGTELPKFIP